MFRAERRGKPCKDKRRRQYHPSSNRRFSSQSNASVVANALNSSAGDHPVRKDLSDFRRLEGKYSNIILLFYLISSFTSFVCFVCLFVCFSFSVELWRVLHTPQSDVLHEFWFLLPLFV